MPGRRKKETVRERERAAKFIKLIDCQREGNGASESDCVKASIIFSSKLARAACGN